MTTRESITHDVDDSDRPNPSVRWLGETDSLDPRISGNKAANLARLLERGFAVPDGFCVVGDHVEPDRDRLWEHDVRAALGALPGPWAVRSSSTAEDGAARAYPGLFLTVLGLATADDVVEAVERVRGSASSELVSRYEGEHSTEVCMSVLVQSLVDAPAAGVAFTRHPVTQRPTVLVEAGLGLGETVVDGSTTPDTLEVAEDETVTLVRRGSKKEKLVLIDSAPTRVPTVAGHGTRAISDAETRSVARVARAIEASFGAPQDVEWALDQDRRVVVVQARPITSAPAPTACGSADAVIPVPRDPAPRDPLPPAPAGVEYALTAAQSVLFTDLCLRGNTAASFRVALDVDHEPSHICYDDGVMSWDYTLDEPFVARLGLATHGPAFVIMRFLDLMGRTSRGVVRAAEALGPAATRPRNSPAHVLADLRAFWDAYELNMTSLFTFWNIEALLAEGVRDALAGHGREDEAPGWLAHFATPSEKNHFVLEQESFARTRQRFLDGSTPREDDARALVAAAGEHARRYGFLFAPFNLSLPPDAEDVVERLVSASEPTAPRPGPGVDTGVGDPASLPPEAHLLGHQAGQLAFWKSERLDAFAQADALVQELYAETADMLDVGRLELFTMTRAEIEESLETGRPVVAADERARRAGSYARVLHAGRIGFHEPSAPADRDEVAQADPGTALEGMSGGPGTVEGHVRVVTNDVDLSGLEHGEVLVTPMTRVEMGAALDRAIAFVTDEGGIICHAAILAREKGKPCVIGARTATAVLRNGMRVRVDGSAGVVHVL